MYNKLIKLSQDWNIKYEKTDGPGFSLKMVNQWHPFSIKLAEFEYIKNFIIKNNLKFGYEVATAFGISATAAGLGFKETGGKLVTIDAYIEEQYGECGAYAHKGKEIYDETSKGWRSVQQLIDYFKLKDVIFPKIGWSPEDVIDSIREEIHLEVNELDYAFIDGLHTEAQVIIDTKEIEPFINKKKFAIFFHDKFIDKNQYPTLWNYLQTTFKVQPKIVPECAMPHGYDLGVVTNIK